MTQPHLHLCLAGFFPARSGTIPAPAACSKQLLADTRKADLLLKECLTFHAGFGLRQSRAHRQPSTGSTSFLALCQAIVIGRPIAGATQAYQGLDSSPLALKAQRGQQGEQRA